MGSGIQRLTAAAALQAAEANDQELDDLQAHGADVKQHGAQLQEKVKGKTCPHCGKPLPSGC